MNVHTQLKAFLRLPIAQGAYTICELIETVGFSACIVGGTVRDILLGKEITDVDIATSATPEQLSTLFKLKAQSGSALGSVRIKKGGYTYEVTTFRKESTETKGRAPTSITYTDNKTDAIRRDFTINALYLNILSGDITDFAGGLNDMAEGIVRFIGDPVERIEHDPLRLLRAVRLKTAITGQYHPGTFAALRNSTATLKRLSGAVVWKELLKLVQLPNASAGLEDLWEVGALEVLLPELAVLKGIPQPSTYHKEGDVWNHSLRSLTACESTDPITRMAALLHDIGKATTYSIDNERIHFNDHASVSKQLVQTIGKRLNVPTITIHKLQYLVGHHMMLPNFLTMTAERKAHWYYNEWFTDLLVVFKADIGGTIPADYSLYDEVVADYTAYLDAKPRKMKSVLTGNEIMKILQIDPSQVVETVKQDICDLMVQNVIHTKADAIEYLKANKLKYIGKNDS